MNFRVGQKNINIILASLLIFVACIGFLLLIKLNRSEIYLLIVNIIFTFIATFTGIHFSMSLTEKQNESKEMERRIDLRNSVLTLMYVELNLNQKLFFPAAVLCEKIQETKEEIPRFYAYTKTICQSLNVNYDYFNSLISSEAYEVLVLDAHLFNPIQTAYYNMKIVTQELSVSMHFYESFKDYNPEDIPEHLSQVALTSIRNNKKGLNETMGTIIKAKEVIEQYADIFGIKFDVS